MKIQSLVLASLLMLGACKEPLKEKEITQSGTSSTSSFTANDLSAWRTDEAKMNAKIDSLLSVMTLEEKIGQLNLPGAGDITTGQAQSSDIGSKIKEGKVGGLFNIKSAERIRDVQRVAVEESRLKIPLIFGMDVIHGYKTTFPIPLGLASSWDMDLIKQSARIAAQEATADGICWTFSPMVDIARDARWGRIAEGSGEDPYLGSLIARAMVQGYQGDDLSKNNTMMACIKHFALYGASESGRDYNTVDMSRNRMYNEYFPPYKAGVEAGAGSMMASFNELDGIPATGNHWLQTEVLRNQWGFKGFVVTDYTGINEMIDHGMGDLQQVSALALKAGIDMDMVGEGFLTTLKKSLDEGKVSEADLDIAVKRILEAKYRLGLFDNPYQYADPQRAQSEIYTAKNRAVARNISAQSIVLMKNEKQILPLKESGTIAVIGPLVNNAVNMPGTWSVASDHEKAISLVQGLQETVGSQVKIIHAKGSNIYYGKELEDRASNFGKGTDRDIRPKETMLNEAVSLAQQADVVVLAIGEAAEMSGESSSRTDIKIPQAQRDLLDAVAKTGKPIVMVLFTGRPLDITDEVGKVDAILNVWFPGSEAGYAMTDVLFGKVNPSAKLPVTFPRNVGQVPIYYAAKNTGRPLKNKDCKFEKFRTSYLDECNEPLFPFGYGLSYTTFKYSAIQLSATDLTADASLKASITVENTGNFDGAEVVQLYIRDMVGSITRPVKELKGFQKVFLKKGESKTIDFNITTEDLKFYNGDLAYDWEPGEFEIMIGTHSSDLSSQKVNWTK